MEEEEGEEKEEENLRLIELRSKCATLHIHVAWANHKVADADKINDPLRIQGASRLLLSSVTDSLIIGDSLSARSRLSAVLLIFELLILYD